MVIILSNVIYKHGNDDGHNTRKKRLKFSIIYITAAYLNAELEQPIYMRIDNDIVEYIKKVGMVNDNHIRDNGSVIVELK